MTERPNYIKETILSEKKFLSFVTSQPFSVNLNTWPEEQKECIGNLFHECNKMNGAGWDKPLVWNLSEKYHRSGMCASGITLDEIRIIVGSLILLGFELGETDTVAFFSTEIINSFSNTNFIDYNSLDTRTIRRAQISLLGYINYGIDLTKPKTLALPQGEPMANSNQDFGIFRNFIEELNMDNV